MGPLLSMDPRPCPAQVPGRRPPSSPPKVLPASPFMGARKPRGVGLSGGRRGILWWLGAWVATPRSPPRPCPQEAAWCVYRTWLFSGSLHVRPPTRQARPLVFMDEETEAWKGSEGGPRSLGEPGRAGAPEQSLAPAEENSPSPPGPSRTPSGQGRASEPPASGSGVQPGWASVSPLDLVGKGQGRTQRSRRFFQF